MKYIPDLSNLSLLCVLNKLQQFLFQRCFAFVVPARVCPFFQNSVPINSNTARKQSNNDREFESLRFQRARIVAL